MSMQKHHLEGFYSGLIVFVVFLFFYRGNFPSDLPIALFFAVTVGLVMSWQEKVITKKNTNSRKDFMLAEESQLLATAVLLHGEEGVLVEGIVKTYSHSLQHFWGINSRAVLFAKKIKDNIYDVNSPKLVYVPNTDSKNRKKIFSKIQFLSTQTRKLTNSGLMKELEQDYKNYEGILEYWSIS